MPKSNREQVAIALLRPPVVASLAAEIQHLLRDSSDIGMKGDAIVVGWRCGEVGAVTAAVLHSIGCSVTTVGGAAIFTHRPDPTSRRPDTNLVAKHYWLEAANLGTIDFSPTLNVARPDWTPVQLDYVFGDQVFAPLPWRLRAAVMTVDRQGSILSQLKWFHGQNERRAAIYLAQQRLPMSDDSYRQFLVSTQGNLLKLPGLREEFESEVEVINRKLVFHLHELVHGRRTSLRDRTRDAAWREMIEIPTDRCAILTP